MNGIQILKNASRTVLAVCCNMPIASRTDWRFSDYILKCHVDDGDLMYSFFTGELVFVTSFFDSFDYLASNRFLVPSKYEEKLEIPNYQRVIRTIKRAQKPKIKTFEIVTTTFCNAYCFYCYERDFQKMSMTAETADATANYIAKFGGPLRIIWFGGEPLVNKMPIRRISEQLIDKGVSFSSSLTTNGLLITERLINDMIQWNINHVTIKLDGTEERYNKIKAYKSEIPNPYKTVLENLQKIIHAGLRLTVRINIEKHNVEDAIMLAESLRDLFNGNDLVSFIFRPLNNTKFDSAIESNHREAIYQVVQSEMDKTFDAGYNVAGPLLSGISGHCCKADGGHYLLINPNGNLAFCSEDFENNCHGSVFDSPEALAIPSLSENLLEKGEICSSCPKYPNCILTRQCPANKSRVCTEELQNYIMHETKLSMLQEYRKIKSQKQ